MSRILIITPASLNSRKGNRVTAVRWARIARSLGHRVQIGQQYKGEPCDVLVALHARKSAASVERFARQHPRKPIVLALTGTDLYSDIHTSRPAQRTLDRATRLVLLQPHGQCELLHRLRCKVRIIYQSAEPPARRLPRLKRDFEVCVSGHLRPVKDPLRAAMAARQLPAQSKIMVTHLGAALSSSLERRASTEMQRNPRYRWLGELPCWRARQLVARSRLLVLSSKMEGGANVLSEALVSSVPILSTRISGALGMLGEDYEGYFKVGDTRELAQLMYRCENDVSFYRKLGSHCRKRAPLFNPELERAAWGKLLNELSLCLSETL